MKEEVRTLIVKVDGGRPYYGFIINKVPTVYADLDDERLFVIQTYKSLRDLVNDGWDYPHPTKEN